MTADETQIGIEISRLTGLTIDNNESLRSRLVEYINELINDDFPKLVNLLYCIDVSEEKLKSMLNTNRAKNTAEIIAELIIERQKAKIALRASMKKKEDDAGEERW